jgi:two-component system, NarL family, response regulator NreC
MMIRVFIADDHAIVRQGLVSLLAQDGQCVLVGEAADGVSAIEQILILQPQVAVVDITMPGLNGMEVVKRLHDKLPACKVLVLTMHEEQEYVMHMVSAGAAGYLIKDSAAQELIDAVKALAAGKTYFSQRAAQVLANQYGQTTNNWQNPYRDLTDRERQIFHLVVNGKTTKEVARELSISIKTVENHRSKVLEKLQVTNVAELVRYAAIKNLLI